MAAQKGRDILLKVSDGTSPGTFTSVGGVRSKSLSIGQSQVDVTDADSGGWRELLGAAGDVTVSMSGSGIFKDDASANLLEDLSLNGNLREFQMVFGNGDYFQGLFQVASFEHTGEHNDSQQFSVSMESAGQILLIRA